jgi:hypothetical protein
VVVVCKDKHLREFMAFQNNWNNKIIAQFFATLYVEDRGDTRKFYLMMEGRWYEITYEHFARLFDFGRRDANRNKIHMALHLDASKLKFMYPNNKRGSAGTTMDLLLFYVYLNHLFRKTMTPRKRDSSNIPSYNRNILVAMARQPHGFDFCVLDFIWEEIKAISESPLKSCGYASYLMHMVERVTGQTFGCDKEHRPLRMKNELKTPLEDRRAAAPHGSSPPRAARGRGQQGDKPTSSIQKKK